MGRMAMAFSLQAFILILMAGCGGNDVPISPGNGVVKVNPSLAQDIQKVFDDRGCNVAGCHSISSRQANLVLTPDSSYGNLVNVTSLMEPTYKRVVPNDTTGSYLIRKLEGTQAVGERMPLGEAALSRDEIQLIKNWIKQGAQDN